MEQENEFYFFDDSIHVNKFKKLDIMSDENAHILNNLIISVEGSICGVRISSVATHLRDPEIKRMRMGAQKIPSMWKVESEEELYKLLSIYVSLDDYF